VRRGRLRGEAGNRVFVAVNSMLGVPVWQYAGIVFTTIDIEQW
jgi:hypothetical protein